MLAELWYMYMVTYTLSGGSDDIFSNRPLRPLEFIWRYVADDHISVVLQAVFEEEDQSWIDGLQLIVPQILQDNCFLNMWPTLTIPMQNLCKNEKWLIFPKTEEKDTRNVISWMISLLFSSSLARSLCWREMTMWTQEGKKGNKIQLVKSFQGQECSKEYEVADEVGIQCTNNFIPQEWKIDHYSLLNMCM